MKTIQRFSCAMMLMLLSATTVAAPVTYTFTGDWSNGPVGDFGASYIATLVFDNGGSSAANQTFLQADFISARLQSGSYDFTMSGADITSWNVDFTSDGSGRLDDGWFDAANGSNAWHFDVNFPDENFTGPSGSGGYFETHLSNPGTVADASATAAIPTLPQYGLLLTACGLCLLAMTHLRRAGSWR